MKGFSLVTLFALVACSLANRELCPHPEDAEIEYLKQSLTLEAIDAQAIAVEMDLDDYDITKEVISCVSIVPEEDGWGPVGCALGQNRLGGWSIKLVSAESRGIRTTINVYGPDLDNNDDNPDDNPDGPNDDDNEGPIPDEFARLLVRSKQHRNIRKVHQY